jgi:DUF4097 and DUF4098 domain-containing protein YvlB
MKYVILILLSAAVLLGQTITGNSGDYKAVIEKKFDMTPGGMLKVNVAQGDVLIRGAKQSNITVVQTIHADVLTREEMQSIVEKAEEGYSRLNNELKITGPELPEGAECEYEITLPDKFNARVNTAGGDLDVANLDGQQELNTSGGNVTLANLSGTIDIRTAGGDLNFSTISGELRAASSGGNVELKDIYSRTDIRTDGGDIELHRSKNRINLSTSGGDIELRDISGSLSASTMGGSIELTGAEGEQIVLKTMGGDVEIHDVRASVDASTSGGDVQAAVITAPIVVRTMGGGLELTDLQASVVAENTGGDIDIVMTLKDFKQKHDVRAKTTGGDISLTIPAALPATITAEIMLPNRASGRNDIYSDFPLTKSPPSETGERILRSKGEINGGGDAIDLRTNGGNIYIKKGQ